MIGVAYVLFSSPADLIALRLLEGASMAAIQPATFAYVADVTPENHRAEVFGLLTAAISGGLLIGPLLGGAVGQARGFVPAYISCTVIEAVAALLAMLYLREPARHEQQAERAALVAWRRLLTLPLVGAYAATLSFQVVMGIFSALWTIWLRDLGASYTYIGVTYTVFALPQLLLGAIAGRAADRIGRAPLLLWAGVLVSLVYAAYGYITNFWLVIALGIFEGVFLVFQQPSVRGLLADASPPDLRGTAQGVAGLTGAIGAATSAFASLPLYHANKSLPFVLAGAIMVAGSVVGAFAAMRMARAATQNLFPI
jgi:MFS family permease